MTQKSRIIARIRAIGPHSDAFYSLTRSDRSRKRGSIDIGEITSFVSDLSSSSSSYPWIVVSQDTGESVGIHQVCVADYIPPAPVRFDKLDKMSAHNRDDEVHVPLEVSRWPEGMEGWRRRPPECTYLTVPDFLPIRAVLDSSITSDHMLHPPSIRQAMPKASDLDSVLNDKNVELG